MKPPSDVASTSKKPGSLVKEVASPAAPQLATKSKPLDPKAKKGADTAYDFASFPGIAEVTVGWPPVIPLLSCTRLSPNQEEQLHSLLAKSNMLKDILKQQIVDSGASRFAPNLDTIEKSFSSVLTDLEDLLDVCFSRALLPFKSSLVDLAGQPSSSASLAAMLAGKGVVVITDPLLFGLPLEGLACFRTAASVSRDFSLHWIYRRIQSSNRPPETAVGVSTQVKGATKDKAATAVSKSIKSASSSNESGLFFLGNNEEI
jgi:hypothetical protein